MHGRRAVDWILKGPGGAKTRSPDRIVRRQRLADAPKGLLKALVGCASGWGEGGRHGKRAMGRILWGPREAKAWGGERIRRRLAVSCTTQCLLEALVGGRSWSRDR